MEAEAFSSIHILHYYQNWNLLLPAMKIQVSFIL
jgi:hypothetical protein